MTCLNPGRDFGNGSTLALAKADGTDGIDKELCGLCQELAVANTLGYEKADDGSDAARDKDLGKVYIVSAACSSST